MCLDDELIGILSYQLPKHGIYGKFYSQNLMNYFSFVLELRKAIQDIIKSTPKQELALPVTPGPFLFQLVPSVPHKLASKCRFSFFGPKKAKISNGHFLTKIAQN